MPARARLEYPGWFVAWVLSEFNGAVPLRQMLKEGNPCVGDVLLASVMPPPHSLLPLLTEGVSRRELQRGLVRYNRMVSRRLTLLHQWLAIAFS